MKDNFAACMEHVFAFEGGYVNHYRDPGGETNFGISKRAYPNEDIKNMTRTRAATIYRRDYWDRVRGDDLPAGLDLVAFDAAVNSGVSRGAKWLQGALGVDQDGIVGPATLKASRIPATGKVIDAACDARMAFLRRLSTWDAFGRGWTRRVEAVRRTAHEMATQAPVPVYADHVPEPAPAPSAGGWAALWAWLMGMLRK